MSWDNPDTPPDIIYKKRPSWRRVYSWDFSNFAEFHTETPEVGVKSASVSVKGDKDNDLKVLGQTIVGHTVQLLLAGGTSRTTYTVTVTIGTEPNDYILDWDGIILITT